MAEDFSVGSLVIPGTYIRVRAEALVSAGGVSTGNIGIVGTAAKGTDLGVQTLSDYRKAAELFGDSDAYTSKKLNLLRALELLFRNGASTVYACAVAEGTTDFATAFGELIKRDVQILVAPELPTADGMDLLKSLVETAESNGKDMIAVVGSDATTADNIIKDVKSSARVILAAPGITAKDPWASADDKKAGTDVVQLPGRYTAAAAAGLLSTLTPQTSPTNKTLAGVRDIAKRFSYGETKDLVNAGVLLLENREGIRVVRGITTNKEAFKQITTRRIVDYAKAGIRRAGDPFIGKLNNQRVRAALQGTITGFLTGMLRDEALTSFALRVWAERQDEIEGRAIVDAVLQPTFSIDFIAVTLVLE